MQSVHHHPDDDVLWSYHSGAMTPGASLLVRAHVETCPKCRSELKVFEGLGGLLLERIEGVPLGDTALDLALARIERPVDSTARPLRKRPAFLDGFDLPPSLAAASVRGRYWAAPGVWIAPIDTGDTNRRVKTYLMYVKAGMVMPEHTHEGEEMTLMLKGSFTDTYGTLKAGDFAVRTEADSHSPAVSIDEDCLCLVMQTAPIVPKTWLGRILQPFARI